MGCGCKKKKITYDNDGEVIKDKITLGTIIKKSILMILFLITSPLILLIIWGIGINSIVGGNFNIIDILIQSVNKKNDENVIEDAEEYNIEDLELLDTEIIK